MKGDRLRSWKNCLGTWVHGVHKKRTYNQGYGFGSGLWLWFWFPIVSPG
jgi:hypothetical protein